MSSHVAVRLLQDVCEVIDVGQSLHEDPLLGHPAPRPTRASVSQGRQDLSQTLVLCVDGMHAAAFPGIAPAHDLRGKEVMGNVAPLALWPGVGDSRNRSGGGWQGGK